MAPKRKSSTRNSRGESARKHSKITDRSGKPIARRKKRRDPPLEQQRLIDDDNEEVETTMAGEPGDDLLHEDANNDIGDEDMEDDEEGKIFVVSFVIMEQWPRQS